jgi:hypothetical protein
MRHVSYEKKRETEYKGEFTEKRFSKQQMSIVRKYEEIMILHSIRD